MDLSYRNDILMKKLAIYEFGCRSNLYLMLTHCLSIVCIRKDQKKRYATLK